MNDQQVEGKKVITVGGGASAIEVVENAFARVSKLRTLL